jgi:hypothetical protein
MQLTLNQVNDAFFAAGVAIPGVFSGQGCENPGTGEEATAFSNPNVPSENPF